MERFLKEKKALAVSYTGVGSHTTGGSIAYRLEWNRARGVGGSTLHWEGYTLRFHANDFKLRTLYGIGDDRPVSYEKLEPYYGKAEKALAVAGAGAVETARLLLLSASRDFPDGLANRSGLVGNISCPTRRSMLPVA